MKTATRERTAARLDIEVRALDPAEQLYLELSEDRRRMFHENRRILILDDSASTGRRLKRTLGKLYPQQAGNSVEYVSDPDEALERIKSQKLQGTPYDAVLLDLFLKNKKGGAQVMKEMHGAGAFTAVVINTASMMDDVVSDIVRQFDKGMSAAQMDAWYEGAKGDIARPILFRSKNDDATYGREGVESLANMLDAAMLRMSRGEGDAQRFLQGFDPMLVARNLTAEVTHEIIEEKRNMVAEVDRALKRLDDEYPGYRSTQWWRGSHREMARALEHLRPMTFKNTHRGTPPQIADRLHAMIPSMYRLMPPESDDPQREFGALAGNRPFMERMRELRELVKGPYDLVSELFMPLREYVSPTLNVSGFVKGLMGGAGELEGFADGFGMEPRDKDRTMGLIEEPIRAAMNRAAGQPGAKMKVTVDWVEDIALQEACSEKGMGANVRAHLQKHGCRSCCIVRVEDTAAAPKSLDDAYSGTFMNSLSAEQLGALGHWSLRRLSPGLEFTWYLNMDEKKQPA